MTFGSVFFQVVIHDFKLLTQLKIRFTFRNKPEKPILLFLLFPYTRFVNCARIVHISNQNWMIRANTICASEAWVVIIHYGHIPFIDISTRFTTTTTSTVLIILIGTGVIFHCEIVWHVVFFLVFSLH